MEFWKCFLFTIYLFF